MNRASNDPPGGNRGRDTVAVAREASHAVVVAFELDTVPVHGRRLRKLVHDGDADRFAALQEQIVGPGNRGAPAMSSTYLRACIRMRVPPPCRPRRRARPAAAGAARRKARALDARTGDRNADHRSGHHLERMIRRHGDARPTAAQGCRRVARHNRDVRCRDSGTASCQAWSASTSARTSARRQPLGDHQVRGVISAEDGPAVRRRGCRR